MNKFYITTAIPYVNGAPHIGHAYEFVITDAIARYYRLQGIPTILLTGADENALKNVQAAEKQGLTVQQLCDQNSQKFRELFDLLGVKYDIFQRGSDQQKHWPGVVKLWQLCVKSGDIYKKKYRGLYCVSCEFFYPETELVDGLCPVHKLKPELVEEENYFFRLSKYEQQLKLLIEQDQIKIYPQSRKNETLGFIKQGLEDISISRSNERAKNWGVPVPDDPSQRIYVWFDALDIYQTGVGFGIDDAEYTKWWPADAHVIGKDIYRFHTVYWPAILLSAGLPLPKTILIHGFLNVDGEKMSKTLGNVVDPFTFISNLEQQGLTKDTAVDALRYYLLTQPITDDGDFSVKRFRELYNANLANGLGNLVARVAKLCEKNGVIAQEPPEYFTDGKLDAYIFDFKTNEALALVWSKISVLDREINEKTPWLLSGNGATVVLEEIVHATQEIAVRLKPFLSHTAEKILQQFSGKITVQPPLFPRLP